MATRTAGSIARCTFPTTRSTMKNFISRPAISASRFSTLPPESIGTLVCWDQWYPEGARLTALQGAQILVYPTAIGWHPAEKAEFGEAQHDAWRTIQRAHAIANGVYVGVVNRVGFETGDVRGNSVPGKGLEFWEGRFSAIPWTRARRGLARQRRDSAWRSRPATPGRRSPQLALPAGPPHR